MGLSPDHVFSSKNGNNYYTSMNLIKKFCKRHQIVETSIKNLSYSMILSVNFNLFYGRIYHDVPGTYIV